jgi:hypothetical protein
MNVPAEWKKIPGVLGIGSGINVHHGFVALQVYVKAPSMIPSIAARVPRSIDGVAVLLSGCFTRDFSLVLSNGFPKYKTTGLTASSGSPSRYMSSISGHLWITNYS